MLALALFLQLQQPPAPPAGAAPAPGVDGRGAPTVTIPRIEEEATIDGVLDEPAWSHAARLTGFSQYQPVDSRPAEERTEVLVWYSPKAIHFGIIAYDSQPGAVRATVADRDNLDNEDTVTVYLDTFNDRRRAFFFTVNPLGSQQDGVRTEGAFNAGTMYGGSLDKNPDFQWDSKGRVTDTGYVVEIRIPFKSLRYPGKGPQKWGINIDRKVHRTGYEDTWTEVHRAGESFLGQAGAIDGLHDLDRGVVTEIQPVITTSSNGALDGHRKFVRDKTDINPGLNVRLGFTNVAVDTTVNPDFSQVESDAGQVTVNQRYALYYAEKRPFFLEGIELFSTPNQLVYTRQITAPLAGAKVTGKFGQTTVAYLTVKEKEGAGDALVNVARIRTDIGADSTAGITVTDRTALGDYNRLVAADSRIVFKKLYYVQGQIGGSWTQESGTRTSSPVWLAEFDRTGRAFGFNYKLTGIGRDFQARAGYVPRNDMVEFSTGNRLSLYGARGRLVEQFTVFGATDRIWEYSEFGSNSPLEGSNRVNVGLNVRGGWSIHGTASQSFARFQAGSFAGYQVATDAGLLAFALPARVDGLYGGTLDVTTPTYRTINAEVEVDDLDVPIYAEGSEGHETQVISSLYLRPTASVRATGTLTYSRILRARDDSEFARAVIPRLKLEYQPTRALFFRLVGEYDSTRQAAPLDPRTGQPLYQAGSVLSAQDNNGLRVDFLISYQPTPGTVAFFGYGNSLATPRALNLSDLRRQNDGFFVKLAYMFRR